MTNRTIIAVLAAALTIAGAAPALAKKQNADQVYAAQKQAKKAKGQSGKDCFLTAPPFMRNPRFMNRGFFKKKCRGEKQ